MSTRELTIEGLPVDVLEVAIKESMRANLSVTAWVARAIRAAAEPEPVRRYRAYKVVDAAQAEFYRFLLESGFAESAAMSLAKELVGVGIYLQTEQQSYLNTVKTHSRPVESRH
jgi:hypothetical protein